MILTRHLEHNYIIERMEGVEVDRQHTSKEPLRERGSISIISLATILAYSGFPEVVLLMSTCKAMRDNMDIKAVCQLRSQYERKLYKISADYKKATYQTERWTNSLSNGKNVTLLVTSLFRWGNFEIELSEMEKEEILNKDSIVLNDYICTCEEMWDGCAIDEEIENEEMYTEEERREIRKMIYYADDTEDSSQDSFDSSDEYSLDIDILDANKWDLDDTIYGFYSRCRLELIS